jgi:predicted MPP superfamily phosphohydrolase
MSEDHTTSPPKRPRVLWVHVVDKNGHYIAGSTLLYFADGILAQSIHLGDRPCRFEIDPPDIEVNFTAQYNGIQRVGELSSNSNDVRIQFDDIILTSPIANNNGNLQRTATNTGGKRSIRWLHLTDLHFNTDASSPVAAQEWLWPRVREEFYRDMARVYRRTGPWALVFFSGDLVQSGTTADYSGLDKMLEHVWEEFRRLGCDPILLAVPGNHDLKWPEQLASTVVAMRSWMSHEELRKLFWSDDKNEYRELIRGVFSPYAEWWGRQPRPSLLSLQSGLIPGDFSASYQKDGLKLGIIGLNSAFLQLGKGVRAGELLDLDPRQLHAVCKEGADVWAKSHDFKILTTHHPPSWLNEDAQQNLLREIAPGDRFDLHLFGHMHETKIKSIQMGGGGMKRELQGASLFGLEYWQAPEGRKEQRVHGYTAGLIEVEGIHAKLRVWPRIYFEIADRSWRMGPDREQDLNDDESIEVPLRDRSGVGDPA